MRVLITGGCGFIGTNLVLDRVARGDVVRILDNCSRSGAERNRVFLERELGGSIDLVEGDVRDASLVSGLVAESDVVFHLAAQVAVTSSVENPVHDFEVNAGGTLNVLEGARLASRRPGVIFASTNKVYGGLETFHVTQEATRFVLDSLPHGVGEDTPLDFHSPYGCSKGSADQYAIDYARIYRVPTVVLRQSCIYGPWQHGNEDQGWIAHFLIRALRQESITLYGDGRQVRDVLDVGDLIELYERCIERLQTIAGRAYNVGGGMAHTTSLLEFVALEEQILGQPIDVEYDQPRPGDQRVYVSDIRRVVNELDWVPNTPLREGVVRLVDWLRSQVGATPDVLRGAT